MNDFDKLSVTMARKDFYSFFIFMNQDYSEVDYQKEMAIKLNGVSDDKIPTLIFSLPPGAGKSDLVTCFVAFMLGKHPSMDILYLCHSGDLASGMSNQTKDVMKSDKYQYVFVTKINKNIDSKKEWHTDEGGKFRCYGVDGRSTGSRGHLILVDDPYGTRDEAESTVYREKVIRWFDSTISSRGHGDMGKIKTKFIILMQRWNQYDLVQHVLDTDVDTTYISIPAIQEKDGEKISYFPQKYSVESLLKMQAKNPYFASQYQQDVSIIDGNFFKKNWINYESFFNIENKLQDFHIIVAIDPSDGEKKEDDGEAYVVIAYDIKTDIKYIIETHDLRLQVSEKFDVLFGIVSRYINIGKSFCVVVESNFGGKQMENSYDKEMQSRNIRFDIHYFKSTKNKEVRIKLTLQPEYSSGKIKHVLGNDGMQEMERQLFGFPNCDFDDIPDGITMAVNKCNEIGSSYMSPEELKKLSDRLG